MSHTCTLTGACSLLGEASDGHQVQIVRMCSPCALEADTRRGETDVLSHINMHGRTGPIPTRSIGIINCTLQGVGQQLGHGTNGARLSENADNSLMFRRANVRRFQSYVRQSPMETILFISFPRTIITLQRIARKREIFLSFCLTFHPFTCTVLFVLYNYF